MSDPVARLNAALEGCYAIEREVALNVLKPELAAVVGAERFLAEDRPAFRFSQCERKFGGESLCR